MTKIITLILFFVASVVSAQSDFEEGMQDALTAWKNGNSKEALTKFDQIASVEKENFLPNYYISLINTLEAFETKDRNEMKLLIEKAQIAQDKINNLLPDDPEVLVLQAMIHTLWIVYDPMANGRQLSSVVLNIYKMAEGISPNNPRVVLNKAKFEIRQATSSLVEAKVSIPFEVYAFTNEWRKDLNPHYQRKEGLICVSEEFCLLNIFTSKVNSRLLEAQMINIWRLSLAISTPYSCQYSFPGRLSLSGTPLNESLIALHQILPKFRKDNKLQKVQCVILTDGEANYLPYHHIVKRGGNDYMGARGMNPSQSFLRDRKIGTTYKMGKNQQGPSEII